MILKQFLKPDWRKIVIFVLISILISLIPVYPCEIEVHGIDRSLPIFSMNYRIKSVPIYMGIISSIMGEDILSYEECGQSDEIWWISCKCYPLFSLPFSLTVLIVSYLLSYLIIWIYDRLRKGRKK